MKNKTTQRGFRLIEFRDRYRQPCSLQESSLATEGCIWFGVDTRTDLNTGKELEDSDNHRMHLTQGQVAELLPYLQHFVRHGVFPEATQVVEARIEYVLQTEDERFLHKKKVVTWGPSHRTVDFPAEATRFPSSSDAAYYVEQGEGSAWSGNDALQRGTLKIVAVKVIPAQVELVQ